MKTLCTLALSLLLFALIPGCQLAATEIQEADTMIGAIVETRGLGFVESDSSPLFQGTASQRFYATATPPPPGEDPIIYTTYVFEGLEWPYAAVMGNPADLDSVIYPIGSDEMLYQIGLAIGDEAAEKSFDATLYVKPGLLQEYRLFPLYLDGAGSIYFDWDSTAPWNGVDETLIGHLGSQTLSASTAAKDNTGKDIAAKISATVHVEAKYPAETLTVTEMSPDHQVLSHRALDPKNPPAELTPAPETAYLILATQVGPEGALQREVLQKDITYYTLHYAGDKGVLLASSFSILWG